MIDHARASAYTQNNVNAAQLPANLARNLICRWNEGLRPRAVWDHTVPFCQRQGGRGSAGPNPGARGMRHCPCITTQAQCNAANECTWLAGQNACVGTQSRHDRGHWAHDVAPYAGDWNVAGMPPPNAVRNNARFVQMIPGPGRGGACLHFHYRKPHCHQPHYHQPHYRQLNYHLLHHLPHQLQDRPGRSIWAWHQPKHY